MQNRNLCTLLSVDITLNFCHNGCIDMQWSTVIQTTGNYTKKLKIMYLEQYGVAFLRTNIIFSNLQQGLAIECGV